MSAKRKKILILEGVTTSGKTSVYCNLQRFAAEHRLEWKFVPESETVIPIIDSTNQVHNNQHLLGVVDKALADEAGLYVFDRLHLSSFFKTGACAAELAAVELQLSQHDAHICMLFVPEFILGVRIKAAMRYRDVEWSQYVLAGAGGDEDRVADIYLERQRRVTAYLQSSQLKHHLIDTTDENFVRATRQIVDSLDLRPAQLREFWRTRE